MVEKELEPTTAESAAVGERPESDMSHGILRWELRPGPARAAVAALPSENKLELVLGPQQLNGDTLGKDLPLLC